MEIERKFILDRMPPLPVTERSEMYQGYISTNPTVRIRSKQVNGKTGYRLCFKGEGTLCREEIEIDIPKDKFDALASLIGKPLIYKVQTKLDLGNGLTVEYNEVEKDRETGFCYAEVEFATEKQALAFDPPDFLGREVTGVDGFSMGDYWRRTRENK